MSKVFLSYSSQDEAFVREFYQRLKRDGVNCFFDRESIREGTDWVATLDEELKKCHAYVVVLTPAYFNSKWTKPERSVIINEIYKGDKKIIPLLLQDCKEEMTPFLDIRQSYDVRNTDKYKMKYLEICRVLGGNPQEELVEEDRSLLPDTGGFPAKHRMPYRSLGNIFKGRVKDMWDLDDKLRKGKTALVAGVAIVMGMGGLGKTQLAIEYVHRFGKFYSGGVFWVNAEQGISTMITQIAHIAGIEIDPKLPEKEQLLYLWQNLGSGDPVLVVLDNFMKNISLENWLPTVDPIRLLVTTQLQDMFKYDSLKLSVLDEKEGIELLNSGKSKFGPEAGELVEVLGGLPLALELARNFLNLRVEFSINDLLVKIKRLGEMDSLKVFAQKYGDELPSGHAKEVAATFQLSWDLAGDFARDVMTVTALLAPTAVPRRFLRKIFNLKDEKELDDSLAEALTELSQKLSLLNLDQDHDPSSHRLVSAFVRSITKNNTQYHHKIISTLLDEMKRIEDVADTAALKELEKVLPHGDYILTRNKPPLFLEQQIPLSRLIGRYYTSWGQFRVAERYMSEALALAENHYLPDHPQIATCLSNLGFVLNGLGQFKKSLAFCKRELEINIKNKGKEHFDVAISLNNQGEAYRKLGEVDKAIQYFEDAIHIFILNFREESVHVALTRNNLGIAYDSKGQYETAIKYYKQALESDLKNLGEDHLSVARDLNNLGNGYQALRKYDKALNYFERAEKIVFNHFGKEHCHLATIQNNRGFCYDSLGEHDIAIEYYKKALAIYLKTFEQDHPDVASCWNNLGGAYYEMGNYKEAFTYFGKALAVFKKILGDDHPLTIKTQKNLDSVREKMVGQSG